MTETLLNLLTFSPTQPLLFNSGLFLFLFVAFCLGYALLSGKKNTALRLLYVTAFSYYFYYKNAGSYCALLALITFVNFGAALAMNRVESQGKRRGILVLAVAFMLFQLGFFKYTNFFLSSVVPLFGGEASSFDIFVPLGISFFTFQSLSYIVDVYRRQMRPTSNLLDLAFFVSFFPTLLSGPILRARTFLPQLRQPLVVTRKMFGTGLWFIMMGLFKKAVISDYIGENFVNRIFDNPSLYTGLENLMGVYGYALKLLRLLRLRRHRHWYRPLDGLPDSRQLPRPLQGRQYYRLLAPLAYLPLHLASRLPLYFYGGQPLQPLAHVF